MTIRRESAAQVIYRMLRDQIVEGKYSPSTRLREPELAMSLQVSRTPLREALRHLEAEGFVERLPTGGVMVAGIDPDEVRDFFSVRAVLEGHLVREVAINATEIEVQGLYHLLERMEQLDEYPAEVIRLGLDFHDRLAQIAGNERTRQILVQIRRHLDRYWSVTTSDQPSRARIVPAEHARIIDAIRNRDPARAESAMQAHIWTGAVVCIEAARHEVERLGMETNTGSEEAG